MTRSCDSVIRMVDDRKRQRDKIICNIIRYFCLGMQVFSFNSVKVKNNNFENRHFNQRMHELDKTGTWREYFSSSV